MMGSRSNFIACVLTVLILCAGTASVFAQNAGEQQPAPLPKDYILLTIFLKHDESKTLGEINKELEQRNWARDFPPAGVEIESWYVMMGIGQVVTLRVPPEKVREVNRMIELKAWGPYRTEFFLTYDYKAAATAAHEKAQQAK
jgi:uncharacterized protein with GYD domain